MGSRRWLGGALVVGCGGLCAQGGGRCSEQNANRCGDHGTAASDMLVMIGQLVVDVAAARRTCGRTFRCSWTRSGPARRHAQPPLAVDLGRHGGGRTAPSPGCDTSGGEQRNLPVHAARDCTASPLTAGATYLSNVAGATANYTRRHLGGVFAASRRWATGLRFRAPVQVGAARARRRRARRRRPRTRASSRRDALLAIIMRDQRGRLFGASPPVMLYRHGLEHQSRVAARAARQLPLQRVRSPVRRRARRLREGAGRHSVTRHRCPLQNCVASECGGAGDAGRRIRRAHQGAQGGARQRDRRGRDHRAR